MPKRTQGPETYDSDDGFVEDAPKSKKVKKTKSEALKAPRKENSSEPPVWEVCMQYLDDTIYRLNISFAKAITSPPYRRIRFQG